MDGAGRFEHLFAGGCQIAMEAEMIRPVSLLTVVLCAAMLTGCATESIKDGNFQASLLPPDPAQVSLAKEEYRLGPLDKVSVSVFQMRDLDMEKAQIDARGAFNMPLVGPIQAAGMTTTGLGGEISRKLSACCLVNPQVTVSLDEAISQQITVTGAVIASDVYLLRGPTTLMQAITMAKGPDRQTADLRRVAVFRTSNGQRMGALFDVEKIRRGEAPDPQIFGGDQIIVDSSDTKGMWRGIVSTVPLFGIFTAVF